ncbi:MAG: penicillin-binding protein 2 [Zoogloeaceae bacterium]|jgi:cell division protein FtsI (penicillin-binding protein 3)|nr:penicillin-binding protein 2 [Zoogloeaceae bacterium]
MKKRARRPVRFADNPLLQLPLPIGRARFILIVFAGLFLLLIGRAFYLQAMQEEFLQTEGASRYRRNLEVPALRGRILDRDGALLAGSAPMKSVWAIPEDAKLAPKDLTALAKLLGLTERELKRKLSSDRNFVWLSRQIAPETGEKIAQLRLPGIHQDKEFRRYYPTGDVSAHLVGFAGIDDNGLEGAELAFQNRLHGRAGSRVVIRDRKGRIVEDAVARRPAQDGEDIRLSIDSRLQYMAYAAVKDAALANQAKAASAVVLDARTGEILAMANWPTYDPNDRKGRAGAAIRNRAITDSFEPGSPMKPFTAALALERGKFRFDSQIDCAPGRLTIGTATISDAHPFGVLSLAQVIQKSSNVGIAKVAASFEPREMWEMFDKLGFGHAPELDFPGAVGGRLVAWKHWRPIEQATMAYGYGLSVSLLQLAHAYLVFARDGDLIPLSLTALDTPPPPGIPIFSPQTVSEIRAMLEMVTNPGGTSTKARVPGYRVGGKSGTAYKIEGGVYARKYRSSFIGIVPINRPRFVIAVTVDEPSAGSHYGGAVAGPVFSRIAQNALRTLGIPPDAPTLPAPPLLPDPEPEAPPSALPVPVRAAIDPVGRRS